MRNPHVKEPFTANPPDALSDEELLSYLLNYSESDPTETAALLLRQFDNLANLLDANPMDLGTIENLSDKSTALIRLVAELQRRYLLIRSRPESRLHNRNDIVNYLTPLLANEVEEVVFLLCLDEAKHVLGCSPIAKGTGNAAWLSPRSLVLEALLKKASYVVLAHNHPSGYPAPSQEDIGTSVALQELLRSLDICLLDHIIFTNTGYYSMVECGFLHIS